MSLNKLSNDTIKDYLSLGCNKINCNELKVAGKNIISAVYTPTISSPEGSIANSQASYTLVGSIMTLTFQCGFTSLAPLTQCGFSVSVPLTYLVNQTPPCLGITTLSNTSATLIQALPFSQSVISLSLQSPTSFVAGTYQLKGILTFSVV